MSLRSRWLRLGFACVMVVALSFGYAGAADKTRLDQATDQVVEGARSIHYGEIGPGTKDMVFGIGVTIVEGTVYAGKTIGEFFKKTFAAASDPVNRESSGRTGVVCSGVVR